MSKLNGSTMNNPWLSSNPAAIPISYADQIWDEAFSNSDGTRPYKTQAEINQEFLTRLNSMTGAGFTISVVDVLPELGSAKQNTLYLVKINGETEENDYYDEYVYLPESEDTTIPAHFEKIGSTKVDLSNYVTKTEFSDLSTKVDNLETAAEGSVLGVKLTDENGSSTTVATDGSDHYIHLPISNTTADAEGVDDTDLATIAAVKQAVAAVDVSGQLVDYVKQADLDTKVGEAGYIKSDALTGYVQTGDLANYVQTSDLDPYVSSASLVEQDNPSVSAHNLAIPIATTVRTSGAVDTRLATEKAVADVILSALTGYGVKSITISPSDPLLKLEDAEGALTISSTISAELTEANHLVITGNNSTQITDIDMSKFVVDGMLDSVTLESQEGSGAWGDAGTYMHFVFNADSGSKEIWLNVTKLLDAITYNLVANASDTSTLIAAETTQSTQSRTMTLTLGVMTTAAQYQQQLEEGEDRFVTMRGLKDVISTIVMAGEGIVAGAHLDDGATGVDLTVTDQVIQIPIATSIAAVPEGTKLATEGAVRAAISAIPMASDSAAGLMSAEMYNKLMGVEEGATADSALSQEEILAAIAATED